MNTFLTILMVVLFVLLPIYRGARKQLEAGQSLPRKRRWIAGAADDGSGGESEVETSSGVDDLGEPYFSYEYEEAPAQNASKPAPHTQVSKAQPQQPLRPAASVEPAATPWFDLRQAVIYNTVLNNPYNLEINQQNQ